MKSNRVISLGVGCAMALTMVSQPAEAAPSCRFKSSVQGNFISMSFRVLVSSAEGEFRCPPFAYDKSAKDIWLDCPALVFHGYKPGTHEPAHSYSGPLARFHFVQQRGQGAHEVRLFESSASECLFDENLSHGK